MQSGRLKQLTMQNLENNFENKWYENKKYAFQPVYLFFEKDRNNVWLKRTFFLSLSIHIFKQVKQAIYIQQQKSIWSPYRLYLTFKGFDHITKKYTWKKLKNALSSQNFI